VVNKRDIELGRELGRGEMASLFVANFKGVPVAARCIHSCFFSEKNARMFKHVMNAMAKLRHPNLVQFIGASITGDTVILTELMPTSLRKELNGQPMPPKFVTRISLDVLQALHYLHSMQPQPLIHLNVSSTNILLQLQHDNFWKAKLGDYGVADIYRSLKPSYTVTNPAYTPPESNKLSTKIDIFCFGVLLIEMLTGKLPAISDRVSTLSTIEHQPLFLDIITMCLTYKRQDRPDVRNILSILDT
jgi:serine/threonine protein kinase